MDGLFYRNLIACELAIPLHVCPSLSPERVPQPVPCACAPAWPLRVPQPDLCVCPSLAPACAPACAGCCHRTQRPSGVSHSTDFSQFRGLRSPRPRRWPAGFPARATFPAGGPCALTGPFLFALEERDGVISLFLKARSFRLMTSSHPNRREGASSDPRRTAAQGTQWGTDTVCAPGCPHLGGGITGSFSLWLIRIP